MLWFLYNHNSGIQIENIEQRDHLSFPKKLLPNKKFIFSNYDVVKNKSVTAYHKFKSNPEL